MRYKYLPINILIKKEHISSTTADNKLMAYSYLKWYSHTNTVTLLCRFWRWIGQESEVILIPIFGWNDIGGKNDKGIFGIIGGEFGVRFLEDSKIEKMWWWQNNRSIW